MGIRMVLFVSICLVVASYFFIWEKNIFTEQQISDTEKYAREMIHRLDRFRDNWNKILDHLVDDRLSTNRDLDLLTPETKELALEFLAAAEKEGYQIFITEWWRSQERHDMLYEQWRTIPWPIVTRTQTSTHLKWTSFDIAFEPKVYGTAYPDDEQLWTELWELWESLGLRRWWCRRNPDKPHFQNGR